MKLYVHLYLALIPFRIRNFSDKVVKKVKTQILRSVTFPPKFRDNLEKKIP